MGDRAATVSARSISIFPSPLRKPWDRAAREHGEGAHVGYSGQQSTPVAQRLDVLRPPIAGRLPDLLNMPGLTRFTPPPLCGARICGPTTVRTIHESE